MNWAVLLYFKEISRLVANYHWRKVTICVLPWRKLLLRNFHASLSDFGNLNWSVFFIPDVSAWWLNLYFPEISVFPSHIGYYILARLLLLLFWNRLSSHPFSFFLSFVVVWRVFICDFLERLILRNIVRSQFFSVEFTILVQEFVLVVQIGLDGLGCWCQI